VVGEVTEAGEYVDAELAVLAGFGEVEGAQEVAVRAVVVPCVVGHPAGHLGQSCCGGEDGRVFDYEVAAEQPWAYLCV
jgi:hypothetical protein